MKYHLIFYTVHADQYSNLFTYLIASRSAPLSLRVVCLMSSKSLVFGVQVWNHSETACENHYTIENEWLMVSFDTLAICSSLHCVRKLWSIRVQKWIKRNFGIHICVHHRIRWPPKERAEEVTAWRSTRSSVNTHTARLVMVSFPVFARLLCICCWFERCMGGDLWIER